MLYWVLQRFRCLCQIQWRFSFDESAHRLVLSLYQVHDFLAWDPRLGSCHDFSSNDAAWVLRISAALRAAVRSHADEVFLVFTRWDRVDASRVRQDFYFPMQGCTNILGNHEARVKVQGVWPRRMVICWVGCWPSVPPDVQIRSQFQKGQSLKVKWLRHWFTVELPPEMTWPSLVMIGLSVTELISISTFLLHKQ